LGDICPHREHGCQVRSYEVMRRNRATYMGMGTTDDNLTSSTSLELQVVRLLSVAPMLCKVVRLLSVAPMRMKAGPPKGNRTPNLLIRSPHASLLLTTAYNTEQHSTTRAEGTYERSRSPRSVVACCRELAFVESKCTRSAPWNRSPPSPPTGGAHREIDPLTTRTKMF